MKAHQADWRLKPGWAEAYHGDPPQGLARQSERDVSVGRNRRTVWHVPTCPYSGAHFATFPPDLITPMILAGTSQRGVCPVCGAPWERVVEKVFVPQPDIRNQERLVRSPEGLDPSNGWAGSRRGSVRTVTVGWQPVCGHDAEPIPAVVADPFCGTGTAGEVCRRSGRRFVGLDLSGAYLRDLALPRAERKTPAQALEALPLFARNVEGRV